MDINYEVWGTQGTWVDGSTAEQKADIKFAASTQDTYRELYTTGKLQLNEMDLSAAYWGIGEGSIFRNPHYLSPYLKDGTTEVAVDDVIDDSQTTFPLMFFIASTVSQQNTRFDYRYSPRHTTAPPQGIPYNTKIVLGFSYKNVILEPIVYCKNDSFASTNRTTTLYDYIENAVYETYPRITGIGYTSYAGDGTANRSKIFFYPLTTFTAKEYDIHYGTTYFWNQYLSNYLINGVEIGTSQNPTIGVTHTLTTTDINNTVGDSVTALAYKYSVSESTRVPFYYFDSDNDLWQINKTVIRSGEEKWYPYPYIEVTSENAETVRDYILSQIAYLGLPFVYDPAKSAQGKIGDIGVYLPVFDDNGITTGEYKEGTAALELPNAEWVDGREGSGYDPTKPDGGGGDEDEGITVRPSTPSFTLAGHGTKCYALVESDIDEIFDDIYGRSSSSWSKLIKGLEMFGADPMGAIISFKWYPYSFSSTTNSAVYLGNTAINPLHQYPVIDATANSYKSTAATYKWDVERNFVNSRKTTCRLYLPFYGFYELPLPLIISKTLSVYMTYNVPDELATWIISFDDVVYDFVECDPSIDIPLTGSNAAQIALTKHNTALSIAAQVGVTAAAIAVGATMQAPALGAAIGELGAIYSGAGTIGGVIQSLPWLEASSVKALATGGAAAAGIGAGAVASGSNILNRISNTKVQIGHLMTKLPYHGAASSTTFLNLPMYPYIQFIQNVKMQGWNEAEYKIKVGIACDKWVTTNSMPANSLLQTTGIANMPVNDLELSEVQELNEILQSGFCK